MRIYYCIPTYKSFQECASGIQSVMRSTVKPDQIIVIDNSGDGSGAEALYPLTQQIDRLIIWPQTHNLGVAKSWNTFFRVIERDTVIIANDDVAVHPTTLELLLNAAYHNKDVPMFVGDGVSGNAYSLFMLRHALWKKIPFDEKFYPAYFEDNDHHRRLRLAGFDFMSVQGATYDHVGSSTLKKYTQTEMDQHHRAFTRNEQYYLAKWGGSVGNERYTEPFDGEL